MAGEYNYPGTISRRTIRTIQSMEQTDFKLLEKYTSLIWDEDLIFYNFFDSEEHRKLGYSFNDILELQDLGLLSYEGVTLKNLYSEYRKYNSSYSYSFTKYYFINESQPVNSVSFYKLTLAGSEIKKYLSKNSDISYKEWCLNYLDSQGYKIYKTELTS